MAEHTWTSRPFVTGHGAAWLDRNHDKRKIGGVYLTIQCGMALNARHTAAWRSPPHRHQVLYPGSSIIINAVAEMADKLDLFAEPFKKLLRVDERRQLPDRKKVAKLQLQPISLAERNVRLGLRLLGAGFPKRGSGTERIERNQLFSASKTPQGASRDARKHATRNVASASGKPWQEDGAV